MSSTTTSSTPASSLPASALAASQAAIKAALAENQSKEKENGEKAVEEKEGDSQLEPGEIQEVDMQQQAENIRTVFNDPTNFNVKVSRFWCSCAAAVFVCFLSSCSKLFLFFHSLASLFIYSSISVELTYD